MQVYEVRSKKEPYVVPPDGGKQLGFILVDDEGWIIANESTEVRTGSGRMLRGVAGFSPGDRFDGAVGRAARWCWVAPTDPIEFERFKGAPTVAPKRYVRLKAKPRPPGAATEGVRRRRVDRARKRPRTTET